MKGFSKGIVIFLLIIIALMGLALALSTLRVGGADIIAGIMNVFPEP